MKRLFVFLLFMFSFCIYNSYAFNIHRDNSDSYSKELKIKNETHKKNDNIEEEILKNLPFSPLKNYTDGQNQTIPFYNGATFKIPI